MATPTVAVASGDHVYTQILTYRGVIGSGNPWDVTGGGVKASASGSVTVTGVTTTVPDALIVQAVTRDTDSAAAAFSAQTNANLTGIAERVDAGTTNGNGGGFAVWDGVKVAAGATGNTTATVTSSINAFLTIALRPASATLSSDANQSFTLGDPPALAGTLTVTDASTPTITAANGIRIRIPAAFNMTWDTAVTTVTLGGGAAGKVSATLLAYEDSDKTAVLNVTSNFAASDQLTIDGLKFRDFTATSAADNLELVVAGSGGATADQDDKTITIVTAGVVSAGSRILNDNAARTPVAAEDVDVVSWDKSTRFLVTIGIQTSTGRCRNNQGTNKLQWRNVTDSPGTWTNLGTTAGAEMRLFDSANLAHGNNLTQAEAQIAGSGTWNDGEEAETNATDITWASDIRSGEQSAIQFPIDPSGGIVGKTYQFRFIVNPGLCNSGSSLMSVSITLTAASAATGGFNAYESSTAAAAISGVLKTKVSGSTVSVDMIALNTAKNAIQTSFAGPVKVELLNASDNSGTLDSNACRPSWSVIQTLSPNPTFGVADNGRKTISFTEANSYPNARLRITFPDSGAGTIIGCSGDNFALRPNVLASFAVTDNDWQTAGTARTLDDLTFTAPPPGGTGKIHKAGRPFSVRASAMNAAGSPAKTTNYAGTASANFSACSGAACTATVATPSPTLTFASGDLVSDVVSYPDVGAFQLQLVDTSFASVDASDGTPADCSASGRYVCSSAINVGRFVPDNFAIASSSIVPRSDIAACSGSTFTYLGERMNVLMSLEARESGGLVTSRYAGTWARLDVTDSASYNFGAIDSALPKVFTGTRITALPVTASWSGGVATVTAPIAIARAATPDGPFTATKIGIAPVDLDGVALDTLNLDADNSGSNERGQVGGSAALRFGLVRLENAVGSEKLNLPVPIQLQYYNGTSFTKNTDDTCTSISTANFGFGSYSGGITATNMNGTHVSGLGTAFSSGFFTLTAPSPTPASAGAVTLTIDLTAEAKSYLKGNWGVSTYTADPSSRDAFGLFGVQGQPNNFIYFRENY